jgi:hypothetical protein
MEKAGKCQLLKSLLQRYISSDSALTGPASVGVDAVGIPSTVLNIMARYPKKTSL